MENDVSSENSLQLTAASFQPSAFLIVAFADDNMKDFWAEGDALDPLA